MRSNLGFLASTKLDNSGAYIRLIDFSVTDAAAMGPRGHQGGAGVDGPQGFTGFQGNTLSWWHSYKFNYDTTTSGTPGSGKAQRLLHPSAAFSISESNKTDFNLVRLVSLDVVRKQNDTPELGYTTYTLLRDISMNCEIAGWENYETLDKTQWGPYDLTYTNHIVLNGGDIFNGNGHEIRMDHSIFTDAKATDDRRWFGQAGPFHVVGRGNSPTGKKPVTIKNLKITGTAPLGQGHNAILWEKSFNGNHWGYYNYADSPHALANAGRAFGQANSVGNGTDIRLENMYIDRTRSIADYNNTLLVPHRTDNLYLGQSTFEAKNIYIVNKYPYSVKALTSTDNGAGGGRTLTNNTSAFPSYKFENIVWDMSGNITASDMTFDYGGYTSGSLGFLGTDFCKASPDLASGLQYDTKKETVIIIQKISKL